MHHCRAALLIALGEETVEIFRSLPHGQLMIVPRRGHGTLRVRPELLNLAIPEFLDPAGGEVVH